MNEEMPPPTRTVPAATSGITKLALIALGMFAMGFVISRFVPPPEYYREKLAYFETHKDEFDLVFFGASDAHWGISSEIFDDQLKSHGINLRSFNLAVPGSNGYELHHMVRHVMSLDPAKLRYVLIVWRPWRLERQAHTHHRQTWWHSFDVTWLLFEGILMEKEQSLWEKVKSIQAHGRDFFRKILNLGLGPDMIAYWRDPPAPGKGKWDYLAKTGGYEALGPETADRFWPEGAKMREIFLNEQDLFIERTLEDGKRLAELRTREREPGDPYMATLYPRSTAATASQVRILQQNSIEPVYLVPHPTRTMWSSGDSMWRATFPT